jgi:hypothetical protein
LIDEDFVAFVGNRIDQPDLLFIVFRRELDNREIDARVDVTLTRIKRRDSVGIDARVRPRVRRADDR